MGTKPLPGQIHTTGNKWFAMSKLTHCRLVIWVNIGSGNGLLPDGTEPLP